MRFFICLLLAMPVYAQAPNTREIRYQCDEKLQLCAVSMEDFAWMIAASQAKDAEIKRLRANAGCGPWRND
jgi:hypothetical protein